MTTATSPKGRRWRWFYAAAGVAALLVAYINAAGPFQGLLDGCSVRVVPIDVRIPGSPNCSYRLDLVLILIPALLALLLIAGAWRYLRSDRFSRLATALAALAAIVAAVFPVYAVWWLIDYYRLALGVTELLLAGAALAVLGVAVLAAWRTVEALKRSERP